MEYLIPSTDPFASVYDPSRYWRGPVWPVVNRLIADGFAFYAAKVRTGKGGTASEVDAAELIRHHTRQLLERSGPMEYFDPKTGAPLGGDSFSWTAAMWLCWAARAEPNGTIEG